MRSRQRGRFGAAWFCVGLFLLVVGCPESRRLDEAETVSPQKSGGVYRKALANEPLTLDPHLMTGVYAASVVQQVFDGLVQFDADLNVIPSIA